MRSALFPKGKPFIMAPQEVLTDPELTGSDRCVLLALLAWVKRDTNEAQVSRKELSKLTGIPETRISTITSKLESIGWVIKHGNGGRSRWIRYVIEIPKRLRNDYESCNSFGEKGSRNGSQRVTKKVTKTVTENVTPIDTELYTDKSTEELLEIFLEEYPNKEDQAWIRENWNKIDSTLLLKINFALIINNISRRKIYDKNWLAGHIPCARRYLQETRWFENVMSEE